MSGHPSGQGQSQMVAGRYNYCCYYPRQHQFHHKHSQGNVPNNSPAPAMLRAPRACLRLGVVRLGAAQTLSAPQGAQRWRRIPHMFLVLELSTGSHLPDAFPSAASGPASAEFGKSYPSTCRPASEPHPGPGQGEAGPRRPRLSAACEVGPAASWAHRSFLHYRRTCCFSPGGCAGTHPAVDD